MQVAGADLTLGTTKRSCTLEQQSIPALWNNKRFTDEKLIPGAWGLLHSYEK
jgi:hypothetical protein